MAKKNLDAARNYDSMKLRLSKLNHRLEEVFKG